MKNDIPINDDVCEAAFSIIEKSNTLIYTNFEKYCILSIALQNFEDLEEFEKCQIIFDYLNSKEMKDIETDLDSHFSQWTKKKKIF